MATTLNAQTKVNLGILGTLIAALGGGVFWAANLGSNVEFIGSQLADLKRSGERLETKIGVIETKVVDGDRNAAVLDTLIKSNVRRLESLEARLVSLEAAATAPRGPK